MKHQTSSGNGTFTTKLGFVLAAVGSAVGMGNIWMFPYRTGQYGGAAFLIPYLLFVALFGYVGLSGEFALGRLTGTGPIGSYEYAMRTRGKRGGALLGSIPLFGSLGIAIGYAIIVGWVLRSSFGALTGALIHTEPETFFTQMSGAHLSSVPWHVAVVVITAAILILGVSGGIEKINKIMMPTFFLLFLLIAVRVAFLPGAAAGYRYLLVPQWQYLLRLDTWIMAMGQAFFSLSVTGSGMIIYGSYLSKQEDIVHSSCVTALLDTCAAMLAGFAVIPAVFAFGLDPAAGPKLLFITLPRVFQQMPLGRLFALFFFVSVLFAGITSLANMLEAVSEAAQTRLKLPRRAAVLLSGAATLAAGLLIEYEPLMGRWMDLITIYIVPIGAILGAVMIYWVLGVPSIRQELMQGRDGKPLGRAFAPLAKYVYVFLAAVVVVCSFVIPGGIG
ncbi:MAG: sodium-dependent transporter [Agathobaculum sp.]|uniref:sodium-dependent transporter n=1 Tax=Agathobaculum sp. TaxID=2048138 RepID=UPI0025BE93C8|nr:sodium-dependent transporter [Agathobaculum sp.]MCI7125877.1 sodium-dependent transporter [Agathobaculum sp.]